MGALGEFFGFEGRVSRLGYLWRTIAVGLLLLLLAGVVTFVLTAWLAPRGVMGQEGALSIAVTTVYLLWLWACFALATRRVRDMGVEPAHFVPLYAALWVVNTVLLQPMSLVDPNDFGRLEDAWFIVQWAVALPLLFWPPVRGGREGRRLTGYEPIEPTAYLNWRQSG